MALGRLSNKFHTIKLNKDDLGHNKALLQRFQDVGMFFPFTSKQVKSLMAACEKQKTTPKGGFLHLSSSRTY